MFSASEIDGVVQQIAARMQPLRIIIFGSYAKGTATIRSDLDILVIKETVLPMAHRADELKPLLSRSLISIDVHVYTPEEIEEYGREALSFINSVLKSGRTVFVR